MALVALLACIGGLALVVCAFGGFLLYFLPAYAFLTIVSLCNTLEDRPGESGLSSGKAQQHVLAA